MNSGRHSLPVDYYEDTNEKLKEKIIKVRG